MYVNGRFLTQRITGVQRFAREITTAAAQHKIWNAETTLLCPATNTSTALQGLAIKNAGRFDGHLWEQAQLPQASSGDFLVNLCNTAPIFKQRQLVVLHDAAIAALPQNFTPAFRAWYQLMIRAYSKTARKLATVSRFSAGEIARYFNIPLGKIEVVPESGEHILRNAPDYSLHEKLGLETDGYILAVSSHASNKNFAGVVEAISKLPALPFKFVIVGGSNAKIFNSTSSQPLNAIEAGYASDGQLRALYARAACFVYPSFYEGFGLPPLEAMSCGCPVLVSNIACLEETCGNGAAYCDPYNPDDIAKNLALILSSSHMRSELREAGLARAKQFTWERAASVLQEIIGSAS